MSIPHSHLGHGVNYDESLTLQLEHVKKLHAGEAEEHIYFLEHEPVYTIGRTRDQSSLQDSETLPHPVNIISRGGQATYHGPGQLTGYLILDLSKRRKDLHLYMRTLEEALILTCRDFGVPAGRSKRNTGVWVGEKKLASIGVGVRRWISSHGFAINVTKESLSGFQAITPCGLSGVEMTSVSCESSTEISVDDFIKKLLPHLLNEIAKM